MYVYRIDVIATITDHQQPPSKPNETYSNYPFNPLNLMKHIQKLPT